jgi:hypothetical protein
VSLFSASKALPSAEAVKQRRHRLRKQFEESGNAFLFIECRECSKPIKPSYKRGFCPGGACRNVFFKKVQVRTVVRLGAVSKRLSEDLLKRAKQ